MFGGDDYDFPAKGSKPAGGSKLSSLFAAEDHLTSNSSLSLGYTAKKAKPTQALPAAASAAASSSAANQPAAASASSAPAPATTAIHATLVNLLRYDSSGAPVAVGQRAVAILRTTSASSPHPLHVLVAYEPSSQKQDCVATITDSFTISPSPPSYAAFHDDTRQYFACQLAPDQLEPLLRHVAMTRHAAAASTSASPPLIIQELLVGQGERGVAAGDQVKVKYTMSLTAPTHPKGVGALVGHVGSDEKPKVVKAGGKKELAGIEQGIMGMKKGGRRFIVIPPQLGYGAAQAGMIPPNSALLVEITCIKIKHADGSAPSPSPSPAPVASAATVSAPSPLPITAAAATPSIQSPAVVPHSAGEAGEEGREEDSEHRTVMARKMSAMGYRMPGLPGAIDPEHLAVARQAAGRRDSTDSRDGRLSEPPSPALSSVSVAITVPPVHIPAISGGGVVPSLPPHPAQAMPTQQPPQQLQQQQPSFYQPSAPSYFAMQQQPQQQQQPSGAYSGFQSNQYSFNHDPAHYPSSSPSHVVSPSHSPGPPSYGYPSHHHSASLSQLSSFPPPPSSLSSPILAAIDAKLDSLLSSISSHHRALGTTNPSLLYDAPITPAQLIRALTSLMQERDDARVKLETTERKTAELTARIQSMQESGERRWEGYAEEVRGKQALVVELQGALRKAEADTREAVRMKTDTEGRMRQLEADLVRAREEGQGRAEAERQVTTLQLQLKQASDAMEGNQEKDRMALTLRMAERDSEVAQLHKEADTVKAQHQKEIDALHQSVSALKQQLSQQQQDADTAIAQMQATAADQDSDRTRLQAELARLVAEHQNSVSTADYAVLQQRLQHLERDVTEARQHAETVMTEARSRRDADRQQFVAALDRAKVEEYERGVQETLEEAKTGMAAIKEKARATIDQLVREKEEAEDRARQAEEEREQLVMTSRAYVDKLKQQMAARLAQVEEERTSRESDESSAEAEKQAALKSVYAGVSRMLQQHGERRWTAQEVAMAVRAEVQFALSGERPEVSFKQEEKEEKEEEEEKKEAETEQRLEPAPQREQEPKGEKETPPPEQHQHDALNTVDETTAAKSEVKTKDAQEVEADYQRQAEFEQHDESIASNAARAENEPGELAVRSSVDAITSSPSEPVLDQAAASTVSSTSASDGAAEEATTAATSGTRTQQQELTADAEVDASSAEHEQQQQLAHLSPPSTQANHCDSSTPDDSQSFQPPSASCVETSASHADIDSDTSINAAAAASTSADHVEANGVGVASSPEASKHSQAEHREEDDMIGELVKGRSDVAEEEAEDELAPLPVRPLSIDPSIPVAPVSSSSSIAPPTPTILTPPAASSRSHSASLQPSSTPSTPRDAIADPFADPFAEDVSSNSASNTSASASSSSSAAKLSAVNRSNLFADDGEDGDALFGGAGEGRKTASGSEKATVNKTIKNSLFGDDDDDDIGLFK